MITVTDAWVRVPIGAMAAGSPGTPTDAGDRRAPVTTAAYLVLRNPTDRADTLVLVESAAADTVEIHVTSEAGGVARMRPVPFVPVPAGGEAVLEPGGYHLMLIGVPSLAVGDTVVLRLRLRSGRALDVTAPVLRGAPAGR